jgi:type IV secretory pathway VirB6-like protein
MHLLFDLIHLQKFNKFFSLRFEHKKGIKPPLPPCQPLEIIYIYIYIYIPGQKVMIFYLSIYLPIYFIILALYGFNHGPRRL